MTATFAATKKVAVKATCTCPNGGGSQGVISSEIENHEVGCRFRLKLKRMRFEDITIVDSSSTCGNSPMSVRREL